MLLTVIALQISLYKWIYHGSFGSAVAKCVKVTSVYKYSVARSFVKKL